MKNLKLMMMTLMMSFVTMFTFGQTITSKPIYDNKIEIIKTSYNGVLFMYQNPEYQYIIDIVSFSVDSKNKAIELIDKAIFILKMEKTSKEQHIEDKFEKLELIRYGFNQKEVGISNGKNRAYFFTEKELLKIKESIENYKF
jgi:hypothetical protein